MRLWTLALLIGSAALSACDVAISDHRLFTPNQRSTKIAFENGLWLAVDPDCSVPLAKSPETWPKCADWAILRDNKSVKDSSGPGDGAAEDIFLVDGAPALIQEGFANGHHKRYFYVALEPQDRSSSGRVSAAKIWLVRCPSKKSSRHSPHARKQIASEKDCLVTTVSELRNLAAKGPADPREMTIFKWVRAEGH